MRRVFYKNTVAPFLSFVVLFVLIAVEGVTSSTVVKPKKPLFGIIDLTKPVKGQEIAVIKEGETDEYMFRKVTDLAVDSKSNIVLLDFDRILKYNKNGKFIKYIGSPGEGPGEFKFPRSIHCDGSDQFYVLDYQKIICYDAEGTFKTNIPTKSPLSGDFFTYPSALAIGCSRTVTETGIAKSVSKIDLKTGDVTPLFLMKDPETKFKGNKNSGVMGGVIHPYSSELIIAPLPDNRFCFAHNRESKISIADLTGKITLAIDLDREPQTITADEIELFEKQYGKNAAERLKLPTVRPFLERILTDETGRIYVVLKKPLTDSSPVQLIDVFDQKAKYLHRIKLNFIPMAISKGTIYGIAQSAEGESIVTKIKLRSQFPE